jgi:hypothetical protein
MKPTGLCAVIMVIGLLCAAGCVTTTGKNTKNSSSATPPLQGSLVVSTRGFSYPTNLTVFLDNTTAGTVNPTSPLYLMVSEGNHTIRVCADFVCEQETVTIRFGKYVTADFSERLEQDVVIKQPTAQVLDCNKNGDHLSVDIEFINPSKKDLQFSGVVSSGYSYIDDRTGSKKGEAARSTFVQNVNAGQRFTKELALNLVQANSLSYSYPVIEELRVT